MKTYQQELKQRLDIEEKYREMLFRRGYLFTSKRIVSLSEYPFYNLWKESAYKTNPSCVCPL